MARRNRYQLLEEAMALAKSTDPGKVSLAAEDIVRREVETTKKYSSMSQSQQAAEPFERLRKMGMYTYRDVVKAVRETLLERRKVFAKAVGM